MSTRFQNNQIYIHVYIILPLLCKSVNVKTNYMILYKADGYFDDKNDS